VIWELPGVRVGHWSDHEARTGCTVVLCDRPAVASGEVRGSAPATREFSLLDPMASVQRIDAVVLSGGSAFGLAAADGVVRWCDEQGRGFPTAVGRVPIVVGMSLFDLAVGAAHVRPDAEAGRASCDAAPSQELGAVGAGVGCTVGTWRGREHHVPGGLVGAAVRDGDVVVAALVACNPWGDVVGVGLHGEPPPPVPLPAPDDDAVGQHTTIGVVGTNVALDKVGCQHLARAAHDGLARAVDPPHASADGDAFVAMSCGSADELVEAHVDRVRRLGVVVVEQAIRSLGHGR
jgi:L-aminopeptidase/D-esterase-like protein